MPNSPIADLSYRNYDGPMSPPHTRWWPIAKMSMRLAIKSKGFWIWATLSSYAYLIYMVIFYFTDSTGTASGRSNPYFTMLKWHDTFVASFTLSQLLLLIVALLIGAGSIANDNRSNALLVYLSRPVSKLDYIFGKWLGIAIPIAAIVFVPMLTYYGYCAMSYAKYGFFSQDHWIIVKIFLIPICAGIVHASLSIGISSMFNQGRIAGATYAAVYFIGYFFTVLVGQLYIGVTGIGPNQFLKNLFYCSPDGLQVGLAKVIAGTNGSEAFTGFTRHIVPRPDPWFIILLLIVVILFGFGVAWNRIRPVEIVSR